MTIFRAWNDEGTCKVVKKIERKYYKYGTTPNVSTTGSVTISNGVISNFSASNYATIPVIFNPLTNLWEVVVKFTTGNSVTSGPQEIIGRVDSTYYGFQILITASASLYASIADTTSTVICQLNSPLNYLQANTTYWAKLKFTGTAYELYSSSNGTDFLLVASYTSSTPMLNSNTLTKFGVQDPSNLPRPFGGSIDLKRTYILLNNKLLWRGTNIEDGTSSDYDFYKDVDVYYGFKE